MSLKPRKNFSNSLVMFARIADDNHKIVSPEVARVSKSISEAFSQSLDGHARRKSLNFSFRSLRNYHPDLFESVILWLKKPNIKNIFSRYGAYWALSELIIGFQNVSKGIVAHKAFNMDKPGAPCLWGFEKAEDAAVYAKHLELNEGYSVDNSKIVAENMFSIDKSNINKAKISQISPCEAKEQGEIIKIKYSKTRIE
jgi:hypothetical protein